MSGQEIADKLIQNAELDETEPVKGEVELARAELTPSIHNFACYHYCVILGFMLMTFLFVVVFISIPFLFFGYCMFRTYYHTVTIILTNRALRIEKGGVCCHCLPHEQKTILLDRIQDITISKGCCDRCWSVKTLKVETAGQSAGGFAELRFTGIQDPEAFREKVLNARNTYVEQGVRTKDDGFGLQTGPSPEAGKATELLTEIRDVLIDIKDGKNAVTNI